MQNFMNWVATRCVIRVEGILQKKEISAGWKPALGLNHTLFHALDMPTHEVNRGVPGAKKFLHFLTCDRVQNSNFEKEGSFKTW